LIRLTSQGSFANTRRFLQRMQADQEFASLEKYGPIGVAALKAATPVEHGETRAGWYYEIIRRKGYFSIQWLNSHVTPEEHVPIAILIQYGHGTREGGRVQGRDFINPTMRPLFDQIANDMLREVTR
jgi:hypothetical protein